MPKQYPSRASVHRPAGPVSVQPSFSAQPTPVPPVMRAEQRRTELPNREATVRPPTEPPKGRILEAACGGPAPEAGRQVTVLPLTEQARPPLLTRAERRRREQLAREATAGAQPADSPTTSPMPHLPVLGHVPAPEHPSKAAVPTRAERRRLAAAEPAAPALVFPALGPVVEAGDDPAPSRETRRGAERAVRHGRTTRRPLAAQSMSLALVAGALIVATYMAEPFAAATDNSPSLTEDDHLRIAQDVLAGRGESASRAGERDALPGVVEVAAAPETEAEDPMVDASAVTAAREMLEQAAALVATETRATPEGRDQVIAQSAIVRELSNRLAGDAPVTTDPELIELVDAALLNAVEPTDTAIGGADGAEAPNPDAADDGEAQTLHPDESAPGDLIDDPAVITRALTEATAHLGELLEASVPVAVAVEPRPLTPADILEQQAAEGRADAERLTPYRNATAGYANGRIPRSAMTQLSWAPGHFLRPDAAAQFERLNAAFRAQFGINIPVTDSYRSFEGQVAARARVGNLAATPGTSNHGWGIAVDLGGGINSFGTTRHRWMRENADAFGWTLPGWARERGSKPEPWHWEFEGVPTA